MSNYLRNLAARSLGQLDVVHPRRPSRYEPVHGIDDRPMDITVEYKEPEAGSEGSTGTERGTAVRAPDFQPQYQPSDRPLDRVEDRDADSARVDPGMYELPVIPEPEGLDPRSVELDDRRESAPEVLQRIPLDPQQQVPIQIEEDLVPPADPSGDRASTWLSDPDLLTHSRGAQQRTDERGEPHAQGRSPRAAPLDDPSIQRSYRADTAGDELPRDYLLDLVTALDDVADVAGVEPAQRSRDNHLPPPPPVSDSRDFEHEPWPDVDFPSSGQDEPPPIRVTIGRIDVRAVPPPAEPKRARPERPRPQLSLADYLKQRSGGR